jgi:hypothetical protein
MILPTARLSLERNTTVRSIDYRTRYAWWD